jgi:hypothetical protein
MTKRLPRKYDAAVLRSEDIPDPIKDHRLKPLARFFRPDFSPYRNTYEIDYLIIEAYGPNAQKHLFVINVNTKYLHVFPLPVGEQETLEYTLSGIQQIKESIEKMTNEVSTIHYIRGDADKTFGKIVASEDAIVAFTRNPVILGHKTYVRNIFTNWLDDNKIEMFLNSSDYVNKNRTIDRVCRTVRDIVGPDQDLLRDPEIMAQIVKIYNNTPHAAFDNKFTPYQVQMNPDIEEYYIRENMSRLDEVTTLQREAGFFNYKPGNALLIHINKAKTNEKFDKKRRAFNEVARFVRYENGNVNCERLTRAGGKIVGDKRITIPIYYTKYLAPSINEIPKKYLQLIF